MAAGSVDDGLLAFARDCARGDRAALDRFERDYLAGLPAALAHMKLPAALVDEVVQQTRVKLLTGDPPPLVGYVGHGNLRGLVQVVATRFALDHLRAAGRLAPDDGTADLAAIDDDPELAYLKAHYRDAWKAAFTAAALALEPRDRNLLRLHHLSGVTLDALAAMYAVHRATAVRWLADARAKLLSGTRTRLASDLSVSDAELDSIIALIDSRLDASVARLLA